MRALIFFLYLFFPLVSGANFVHAASRHNSVCNSVKSNFTNNEQVKFIKTNQGIIINADFDLGEECSSSDHGKKRDSNKIFAGKRYLSKVWHLTFSCKSLLNYCYKNFKIYAPSCGQSNPIYIIQGVLRI